MPANPLLTTLLDLDAALPEQELTVGGGYGLFLKQTYIADNPKLRTLFAVESLSRARATEDIDLILSADVVTDSAAMKTIRKHSIRSIFVLWKPHDTRSSFVLSPLAMSRSTSWPLHSVHWPSGFPRIRDA